MDSQLSAPEIVMLIEALDALIPLREGSGTTRLSEEELERCYFPSPRRVRCK